MRNGGFGDNKTPKVELVCWRMCFKYFTTTVRLLEYITSSKNECRKLVWGQKRMYLVLFAVSCVLFPVSCSALLVNKLASISQWHLCTIDSCPMSKLT